MQTHSVKVPNWFHYGFLILAAVFLYLELFLFPVTPIFSLDVDHLLNLHNATRMLDGQMIYRDFFQFTTPGTEVVYLVLFRLFGTRAWIPNAVLVLLGLSLAWLCVSISRKLLSGLTAYLPGLLFLLVFRLHLDGNHSWFSVLAVIAAAALLVEKRSPKRVAGAGALCALASFFTQTRGVVAVAGLAVFLAWEHRREPQSARSLVKVEGILAGVFGAVTVGLNLYFIWAVGLKPFLWSTVTFVLKYFPTVPAVNDLAAYMAYLPPVAHWYNVHVLLSWVFIHLLLPLVYLLFFAYYWRESERKPEQPWDRLMLISVVGFSLFVSVAPAPLYYRLCTVALPGLILFTWFLGFPGTLPTLARRALWLGTGVILLGSALHQQAIWRAFLDTPVGRVALLNPADHKVQKWLLFSPPRSKFFFDACGKTYFLLGRRSPAVVSHLCNTDYVRPEQVRNVIASLEKYHVTPVLWCAELAPGVQDPHTGDQLEPLRAYLRTHYHAIESPADLLQILERNDAPGTE